MGLFDYRGQDNAELIGDAYALAAYTSTTTGTSVPDGWEVLDARDLGISSLRVDAYGYFTDDGTSWGGQAKVLVKKDASGNIEQIAISYAATNELSDIYAYTNLYTGIYDNSFDYLIDAVADYAQDNGVSGSDVIVTGYSLGGGAVNAMADGANFNAGGFFEDSNYIGFASPMITTGENVYNFGFENDAVYRIESGNETSSDNIVLFNDSYSSAFFGALGFSILSLDGWDAHLDGFNDQEEILSSIVDSHFYDEMTRDSLVVISNLSDFERSTWVEPVDRVTGYHDGDDAFVLGNSGDDRLRGDGGDDFIDGHAGDDELDGRGGDDALFGGAGDDTLTGGSGDDTFIFTAGFGDDTITDFNTSDDIIEFDSSVFGSYDEVMANAYESGGGWFGGDDVVIQNGGDSITLEGISLNDLDSGNFAFA